MSSLVPHYIWVDEEVESTTPAPLTDHERQLLMEYKAKEAMEAAAGGAGGGGGKTEGDMYEEAVPCHGDEFLHRIITVMQENPGQILR